MDKRKSERLGLGKTSRSRSIVRKYSYLKQWLWKMITQLRKLELNIQKNKIYK